ncbi:hypothetical protein ACFLU8_05365 [Chloroflexota bacterium]
MPPREEFDITHPEEKYPNESLDANIGFSQARLIELSRGDTLVRHISRSVIPVTQDDDVLELGRDIKEFSVVSELPHTRWKIAVALSIHTDLG